MWALKLRIENARSNAFSSFFTILLCALFISHLSLSIVIIDTLYTHGFIILFGINISLILLLFFIAWCVASYFFIDDDDNGELANPIAPFSFIVYFISAHKYELPGNPIYDTFTRCNQANRCCKIINYIIVILLMPIFVGLSPLYSVMFILTKNTFAFWIYYQLSLIIPSTIMQIIIICLNIHFIVTILCMIAFLVGITYLIIITFFSFDLVPKYRSHTKYLYCFPCMISIEILLLLTMIFIVCFMDLWHCDFKQIQYILLLICFINIFFPNLPFSKSFLVERFCAVIRHNVPLQYLLKDRNSLIRMQKIFCILLCVSGKTTIVNGESQGLLHKINVMSLQQIVMEQYKYLQMENTEKKQFIDDNIGVIENKVCYIPMWKQFGWIIYVLSSFISLMSPIVWLIWIIINNGLFDSSQLVFVCCMTGCYVFCILGLIIYVINCKLNISFESVKYGLMLEKISKALQRDINMNAYMEKVEKYYHRFPAIEVIFAQFQCDIAMIIILYIYE